MFCCFLQSSSLPSTCQKIDMRQLFTGIPIHVSIQKVRDSVLLFRLHLFFEFISILIKLVKLLCLESGVFTCNPHALHKRALSGPLLHSGVFSASHQVHFRCRSPKTTFPFRTLWIKNVRDIILRVIYPLSMNQSVIHGILSDDWWDFERKWIILLLRRWRWCSLLWFWCISRCIFGMKETLKVYI